MSTFYDSEQFAYNQNKSDESEYDADNDFAPQDAAPDAPAVAPQERPAEPDELLRDISQSSTLSVVGSTLVFKGELVADEDLLIQGQIQGTIEHNADNLTIGIHGKVNADIRARKILVQGEVRGNMYATERVIVESSAKVTGDIYAPTVGLKEGARFKGSIDMESKPEPAARPEPKPSASASRSTTTKKKAKRAKPAADEPSTPETVSDSVVDATLSATEASERKES